MWYPPAQVLLAFEILQDGPHQGSLWMPYGHSRPRVLMEAEQVQLCPELAVVPALGLLQAIKVFLQLLRIGKGRAVDALEHGVLLVAAPIGPGHTGELEGPHPSGGRNVRPPAQVREFARVVQGDPVRAQVADNLGLVGFTHFPEKTESLVAGHLPAQKGTILDHDTPHLLLDGLKVFGGEGTLVIEIVVETLLNGGADGDLGVREKPLHRRGHDMGRPVPDHIQPFRGVRVDGLQGRTLPGHGRRGRGQIQKAVSATAGQGLLQLLSREFPGQELATTPLGPKVGLGVFHDGVLRANGAIFFHLNDLILQR